MSEFIGTRCDGCGKLTDQMPDDALDNGWEEDDREGHSCPECQEAARALEASQAGAEDLAVFGQAVGETAEAILDSPEVVKMKADRLAAFEKIKKDTLKAIRKEMKTMGLVESDINEVLRETEKDLDDTYNQKFNFKVEA